MTNHFFGFLFSYYATKKKKKRTHRKIKSPLRGHSLMTEHHCCSDDLLLNMFRFGYSGGPSFTGTN